ncbi:DUF4157 domain-containing protein [Microcoleus sp. FACHB-68]|uniref:eCIS core domain-containing protein n=1 Tax=Microcoleus sp. FACHB-68 TaxID=2692826 RepID=UPI001686A9A8|nr:DUF4157 domain-containing protein [Microcoleus sp. FACHB-68]MBD1936707.1 DUF4157 domain-containing protein [Microcoleus sp. FACHB-68]
MKLSEKIGIGGALLSLAIFVLGIYYPLAHNSIDIEYSSETLAVKLGKGKVPKKYSEAAWGKVGAGGYQAAAQWMTANNGKGQPLDEIQKEYLRPHFGDLVDRVDVIYNATLLDEWAAASLRLNFGKSNAQVYGDKIYVKSAYKRGNVKQLILLAHELVHVKQYENLGSLNEFGYEYFKEYERAGQSYRHNIMEREAFEFEAEFAKWLSQELRKPYEKPKVLDLKKDLFENRQLD